MSRPTSHAPIMVAAGVMLTLWGAASSWIVSVAGLIVIGIGTARWIRGSNLSPSFSTAVKSEAPEAALAC